MERKNIDNKIILYNKGGIKVFKVTLIFFQEIKKYFTKDDIVFYININGIVSINNIILFNEEGIFLKNSLELEKIKNITENYFGTIYLIKKNFFKELGIDIFQQDSKKFRVQTKEIFGFFKWRKFEEKLCDIQVFFSIFSILKLIIDKEIEIEELPYLKYKNRIIDMIDNNIDKKIKDIVERICSDLKISIPTYYKIFKIIFNETSKKYIIEKKLSKSCYELSRNDKSIDEIAKNIGFSKVLYLKKFLDYYGYKVDEFRKIEESICRK